MRASFRTQLPCRCAAVLSNDGAKLIIIQEVDIAKQTGEARFVPNLVL